MSPSPLKPNYVVSLETVFGAPSQAGYGSAVFYEVIPPGSDLEPVALRYYRYFVGDLWERFGEAAWMSAWKQVYVRSRDNKPEIISELGTITDPTPAQFVPVLLSVGDNCEQAQKALSAAYNAPDTTDLRIYAIGDGEAISGLLIAGCRMMGETTMLISLLD